MSSCKHCGHVNGTSLPLNGPDVSRRNIDEDLDGKEARVQELSAAPTTHDCTARPELSARTNTNVSIAAAPYACCDIFAPHSHRDHEDEKHVDVRPRSASLSSSASTLNQVPSNLANASRVSTDAYGNTYPEGGLEAYLCVFGSFCAMMMGLGMMNTVGTYQSYVSTHQLQGQSESAIGWIFGLYAFLAFFCGIQIGPIFDAKGPRWLVAAGSVLIMLTYLLLGICDKYWHFLVVFGILGGTGTSLTFTPAIASVGHWFLRKRGQMTGLAAVGGSFGGIVYPLALQALFPKIGFAWSTRVIALINLVLLIPANLCIKGRLPPKKATKEAILPDFRIFRDPVFALTTLGVFFIEWGLFVPLAYLTSYAYANGVSRTFSYQIMAIFNAGSCAGRYFPGLAADLIGRFNSMLLTIALCLVATLAFWLPAQGTIGLIVVYAIIMGFASGSGISLTPVCVGQLCKVENYGRYYATCYTLVSFGSLTGIPIAGKLLSTAGGQYWAVITFTAASYAASLAAFVGARVMGAGWSVKKVY